jgi:hypothetical protein
MEGKMTEFRDSRFRRKSAASLAAAVLFASACTPIHMPEDVAQPEISGQTTTFAGELPQAIDFAQKWREQFYAKIQRQAQLRSALAFSLVPLSAGLVYLGINGSSTELFTGLTAIGAGAYGVSTVTIDGVRDQINVNGALALTCAVAAVSPLLVTKEEYNTFRVALFGTGDGKAATLNEQIAAVRAALDRMNAAKPEGMGTDDQARLDAVAAIIAFAEATRETGFALDGDLQRAGKDLRNTVNAIVDQVNSQIVKRLPDPTAILAAAQAIGKNAGAFSPTGALLPPAKPDDEEGGAEVQRDELISDAERTAIETFQGKLTTLEAEAKNLQVQARKVNHFVEVVTARKDKVAALDSCTVGQVASLFAVTPSDQTVTLTPGTAYQLSVQSQSGIPSAQLVGNQPQGVSVSITGVVATGYTMELVAAKDGDAAAVAGGTGNLLITEGNGPGRFQLAFTIAGQAEAPKTEVKDNAADDVANNAPFGCNVLDDQDKATLLGPQTPVETALTANTEQFKGLQRALGTPVDGDIGKETRMKLCEWRMGAEDRGPMIGQFDQSDLADRILAAPLTPSSPPAGGGDDGAGGNDDGGTT